MKYPLVFASFPTLILSAMDGRAARVSLQEPLVYIYHTIPSGEDRTSTWSTHATRFRRRITQLNRLLAFILMRKLQHATVCHLTDHSQCSVSSFNTLLGSALTRKATHLSICKLPHHDNCYSTMYP